MEAQGLLYRATSASLERFEFVTAMLSANTTLGIGKNNGFFDMMECPDFFPLGPPDANGNQRHVFISSAYLGKSDVYPDDGFHNAVTWWIGKWSPLENGAKLQVESRGIVDFGAVTYYSAKSLAGPINNASERLLGGWVMDSNGKSEPRLCKNGDASPNGISWVICPEALHREVYLCRNTTTQQPALCQRPAPQLQALRAGAAKHVEIDTCGRPANHSMSLPMKGLQLELHLNLTFCMDLAVAPSSKSGSVGLGVLMSSDSSERTLIGYDIASRTLFVDRSHSSSLPGAAPGGGVLPSTGKQGYGLRSREVAPLPEVVAGGNSSRGQKLEIVAIVDHSILTIFANDAAVITTRVYTGGGNASAGVSFFTSSLIGTGVRGSVSMWPLSLDSDVAHVTVV